MNRYLGPHEQSFRNVSLNEYLTATVKHPVKHPVDGTNLITKIEEPQSWGHFLFSLFNRHLWLSTVIEGPCSGFPKKLSCLSTVHVQCYIMYKDKWVSTTVFLLEFETKLKLHYSTFWIRWPVVWLISHLRTLTRLCRLSELCKLVSQLCSRFVDKADFWESLQMVFYKLYVILNELIFSPQLLWCKRWCDVCVYFKNQSSASLGPLVFKVKYESVTETLSASSLFLKPPAAEFLILAAVVAALLPNNISQLCYTLERVGFPVWSNTIWLLKNTVDYGVSSSGRPIQTLQAGGFCL